MSGGIYLIQDNGELAEMRQSDYDSETHLQELLAKHPSLLAGDQINASSPRRWLLVSREIAIPAEQDGAGRWALDHLFLDQDAVPTFVEVKRSTNTQIRREVVGQMLDYAANAVTYWSAETIRSQFEAACARNEREPQQELAELLGEDADGERFWQDVKTNLQAGRVRLLFVADHIPPELQRIIEFLNGQMSAAEVLGVAVQQYTGQGQNIFVPRVVGQTATAQQRKSNTPTEARQWDESSFFQELEAKRPPQEVSAARRILDWTRNRNVPISWGHGKIQGSFYPRLDSQGKQYWPIAVWTYGIIEVKFGGLRKKPPFDSEGLRRKLQQRLNQIPGVAISDAKIDLFPSIHLSCLAEEKPLCDFLAVLGWIMETIQRSGG